MFEGPTNAGLGTRLPRGRGVCGVYVGRARLKVAKAKIAGVLADMVDRGYYDVELALYVARRILHDNGAEFWRLPQG